MKIQCKLCVKFVDLTLDTYEPVAPLARKKKDGKIVIVHVDNKLTEMRNFCNVQTTYWILRNCGFCIQVGIRIGCMSQAQYMVVRPSYLGLAQKDNGNLCNRGSNFRIESDISPCCILSKYDI